MVGHAVALQAAHEAAGDGRIEHAEVDAIARHAHLGDERGAALGERLEHIALEGRLRVGGLAGDRVVEAAVFGVDQELAQKLWPLGRRSSRVDLVAVHGRKHAHEPARAGDQDVEAAPTVLGIQRPEVVAQPAVGSLGVGDADEDDVALVTLQVLQVLYEEGAVLAGGEERLQAGVLPPALF